MKKVKSQSNSASSFKILSFNPNSIGKNPKRQKIFNALKKKNPDILLISDTRIVKIIENQVRSEWGGKCHFSSFTSQARGCAIFFRKEFPAEIIESSVVAHPSGNFLALNIKYENFTITISCIYGPNEDNPDFYRDVVFHETEKLQNLSDFAILAGDWNLVLNQELDTHGYRSENNVNARNVVLEGMENLGFVDIFRELFPQTKRFSWRKFGDNKRGRLDFHLISAQLLPFVQKADILPGISSDHSIVELVIDFSKFTRGRGFFKFNNSLVKDPIYVNKVTETITRVAKQYAECTYNQDFLTQANPEQLQELLFTINPQLLLETLLFEIRGTTIAYGAAKKKEKNELFKLAIHRLESAEKISDSQPANLLLLDELNAAKQEIEAMEKKEAEGSLIRSRIRWQLEGEKPSKYFCNLEKYNALQKYIPSLKTKNEKNEEIVISEQIQIESELKKFYGKLYESQESKNIGTIGEFLELKDTRKCPKISELEASKLEGLISIQEATQYIKKCRGDASPGSSGFTGTFYKFFWRNLKHFVVNSFNFGYEIGNLSVSKKLGVIILLPKPNKDKALLSNWRPISLLNQCYTILSGVLAERLKPTL